jgi:hypothetical protein
MGTSTTEQEPCTERTNISCTQSGPAEFSADNLARQLLEQCPRDRRRTTSTDSIYDSRSTITERPAVRCNGLNRTEQD